VDGLVSFSTVIAIPSSVIITPDGAGHATASNLAVGTTTIVYTYCDVAHNCRNCTFTITAADVTPPDCPANPAYQNLDVNLPPFSVSWSQLQAVDAVDGLLDPTAIFVTPNTVSVTTAGNPPIATASGLAVGITTVTYTYKDRSNNARNCSFVINATDVTPPQCPGYLNITRNLRQLPITWQVMQARDLVDGFLNPDSPPPANPTVTGPGGPITVNVVGTTATATGFTALGDYTVTYRYTDHSGNLQTCVFVITIQATCGDHIVTPPETCDDGNLNSCDGCSPTCAIEQPITTGYCGDGVVQAPETCDFGNNTLLNKSPFCGINCQTRTSLGCSPGFWKNNAGTWATARIGINLNTCFTSIFTGVLTSCFTIGGTTCIGSNGVSQSGPSLLAVLSQGGGGYTALARHAVAAYLNSLIFGIDFPYSSANITDLFHDACVNPLHLNSLSSLLESLEAPCPLGSRVGNPAQSVSPCFVTDCTAGTGFKITSCFVTKYTMSCPLAPPPEYVIRSNCTLFAHGGVCQTDPRNITSSCVQVFGAANCATAACTCCPR